MKVQIDIGRQGSLHFLISALIGAYNRRTDAIGNQDQKQINQLAARLKKVNETLRSAAQPKGE